MAGGAPGLRLSVGWASTARPRQGLLQQALTQPPSLPPPSCTPLCCRHDVHCNTVDGGLELEDLPPGSLLEACMFLGAMRAPGYPMHGVPRKDVKLTVPLLATCTTVQRMLGAERQRTAAERRRADALAAELAACRAQLAGGAGKAVAAELTPRRAAEA